MKFKMISLLLSTGIVLAACGNDDNDDQKNTSNTDNNTKTEQTTDNDQKHDDNDRDNDEQDSNPNVKAQTIDVKHIQTQPEDAINTAKSSFDGDVKQVEFKKENGEWVYDIDLRNNNEEAEVKVSDKDNKVLNKQTEKEMDNDRNQSINYEDAIDYQEAVKKAQDAQQGDLKQWSLDSDDGQFVYHIKLMTQNGEQELTLDAKSGKVLQQEND